VIYQNGALSLKQKQGIFEYERAKANNNIYYMSVANILEIEYIYLEYIMN